MSEDKSESTKRSLFTFEHQESYQKIQFKFYDAVESMDHNNIIVSFMFLISLLFCSCLVDFLYEVD